MKNKFIAALLLAAIMFLPGCSSLQSAYNLKNCTYSYKSISNLTLSEMNLSNGISALNAAKILALLNGSSSSIPLDFTLNLDVYNPNTSQAAFQALSYIVEIDDVEFTTGYLTQAFSVNAGDTKQLPITIGVDLAQLISKNSKSAIVNIAKNFVGVGDEKSKVTVQLKPTFNVGGSLIASPVYIPVHFSFGGK
ncbi:MAG: LEA type 2 family protein [Tannerella sp.]|jgi:LEA14-like dessication related protein|nr:LEA type 2 family protein [Tannerella sp.]